MVVALMSRSAANYSGLLRRLLPPGRALAASTWSQLSALLDGCAEEFARIDADASALPADINPQTTQSFLVDWERALALPDNCSGTLAGTVQGRRAAVLAKLAGTGGQSRQYFIDVAAALGYTISIREYRPFRAGLSSAGDALTNGDWRFAWLIVAPDTTVTPFSAGQSRAGELLASWGNDDLECKIRQLAPAHTTPLFAYQSAQDAALIAAADQLWYVANYVMPENLT